MSPDKTAACGEYLVAILRGIEPARAEEVADAVYEAGFRAIEVPLNSPEPLRTIERLAAHLPQDCEVGAGTVLHSHDVPRVHAAGGRLVVTPNCDPDVIASARQLSLRVLPGVATATEAFAALRAGATQLKLFPAITYGPRHVQALRAVLPPKVGVFPVGGVALETLGDWLGAGATGFGFGSELFRPDYRIDEIRLRAERIVAAFQEARAVHSGGSPRP
jgi:2-dehydro-3-deoxyphosphogalactonate aldolase